MCAGNMKGQVAGIDRRVLFLHYADGGQGVNGYFFFSSRRRHTRCSRDWSSDVCSSDLGTLYPLIAEALSGAQLSIGAPYFDRVEVPIGLALLFLMGLGPQLPWHGASRATLERQFTAPLVAAALGALVAILTGLSGVAPVLTYALAAFVTATVVQEFARGIRARRTLHGEAPLAAFVSLFRRNGRRYGGYVV